MAVKRSTLATRGRGGGSSGARGLLSGGGARRLLGGGGARRLLTGSRLRVGVAAARAGNRAGTGNGVGPLARVQVVANSGVTARIGTRERNARRVGRATGGDSELSALHVELSTGVVAGGVEGDELTTEQIVSGSDARGNGDSDNTIVGNQLVDGPLSIRSQSIFVNLEPSRVGSVGEGVGDFGHVDLRYVMRNDSGESRSISRPTYHDGTLVGSINDTASGVYPAERDLVTSLYRNLVGGTGGNRVGRTVADDRVGEDVLNGSV